MVVVSNVSGDSSEDRESVSLKRSVPLGQGLWTPHPCIILNPDRYEILASFLIRRLMVSLKDSSDGV